MGVLGVCAIGEVARSVVQEIVDNVDAIVCFIIVVSRLLSAGELRLGSAVLALSSRLRTELLRLFSLTLRLTTVSVVTRLLHLPHHTNNREETISRGPH